MKYSVCAYFDTQLGTYMPPFAIPQDKETIREGVRDATIKGKIDDAVSKVLFFLGTFETSDASFDLVKPLELLNLASLVQPKTAA